jgi:hypothetical protein
MQPSRPNRFTVTLDRKRQQLHLTVQGTIAVLAVVAAAVISILLIKLCS